MHQYRDSWVRPRSGTHPGLPDVKLDPPPPDLPAREIDLRTYTAIAFPPPRARHEHRRPRQSLFVLMLNQTDLDMVLMFRRKGVRQETECAVRGDGERCGLVGRIVCQLVESIVQRLSSVFAYARDW